MSRSTSPASFLGCSLLQSRGRRRGVDSCCLLSDSPHSGVPVIGVVIAGCVHACVVSGGGSGWPQPVTSASRGVRAPGQQGLQNGLVPHHTEMSVHHVTDLPRTTKPQLGHGWSTCMASRRPQVRVQVPPKKQKQGARKAKCPWFLLGARRPGLHAGAASVYVAWVLRPRCS